SHPVRIGEHDQTAFGLGLMLDYARTAGNEEFAKLVSDSARKFFLADKNCPLVYEPSGEDFLSPSLGEADVMRRVLPQSEFAKWFKDFMPQIPTTANADWLPVAMALRAVPKMKQSLGRLGNASLPRLNCSQELFFTFVQSIAGNYGV